MALLPRHDRIDCQKCFSETAAAWGRAVFEQDGWRLEHNPCAWGAQDPNVLVLGFSKGNSQTGVIESSPFNEVPFRGMRTNLTRILQRLGLLGLNEQVDARIRAAEQDYAFGSVIRCSIAKDGKKAGDVINAAATDHVAQRVISNCTSTFLRDLPSRLRTIVLLSNDDHYVEACFARMKVLHPDIQRINEMAYGNDRVTWVHVIHPSGSSGRHITDWLDSERGRQAEKRELALAALALGRSVTVSPPPPLCRHVLARR